MQVEIVKRFTFASYILLFLVVGALIAIGVYFRQSSPILLRIIPESHPSIRNSYWVTVALGILIVPIACLGFYCLYRMDVVLLTWQVGLLFFLALCICGLGLYCIMTSMALKLEDKSTAQVLDVEFMPYYNGTDKQEFVDWIQNTFRCCGAHGLFWWYRVNYNYMPSSCYVDDDFKKLVISYTTVCNVAIMKYVKNSLAQMGYMILGADAALMLLMFFPVYSVYNLRVTKAGHWNEDETDYSETDFDTDNEY